MMPMIQQLDCRTLAEGDPQALLSREWLLTNGLGGYASGTIAGACTRRYHGLLGERFLPLCKPGQVIVSISHSALFDEVWLADALASDRLAAVWLDSLEPGALDPGRPLHGIETLQVSPRVASTTREAHLRSAWSVAKRIDELLRQQQGT